MDKIDFIKKYNIRDARPIDPTLRVIPAEGFATGLAEFINERFRGVAKASSSVSSLGSILISSEYVAMFLKVLLTDLYGRCLLTIDISSDNEMLTIDIKYEEPLPLSDSQMRNLIRLARNGGMLISLDEGLISLTAMFEEAAIRRVYAISVNDGRRIILSKLGEIFYSGEYFDPDERYNLPRKVKTTKSRGRKTK